MDTVNEDSAANLTAFAPFSHVTAKPSSDGVSPVIDAVSAVSSGIAGELQMVPRVLLV